MDDIVPGERHRARVSNPPAALGSLEPDRLGEDVHLPPGRGIYASPVPVQSQASEIAWDAADRARAYMRPDAREPLVPGGPLGGWFECSGPGGTCG